MGNTVLGHQVLTLKSQNVCFIIHDICYFSKQSLYIYLHLLYNLLFTDFLKNSIPIPQNSIPAPNESSRQRV